MLACEADLVLRAGELFLKLHEVLVRLQVRVALREREQLAQRAGEHVLGLGLIVYARGVDRLLTGLDDRLERLPLVGGVALDRVHEVGDQVVATLELDVDVRPGLLGGDLLALDAVVDADDEQRHDDHHGKNDEGGDHDHLQ